MKNKEAIKQIRNQIKALQKHKLELETEDRVSFWVEKLGYVPAEGKLVNMNNKEYYIEYVEPHYSHLTIRQRNESREFATRTYIDSADFRKDSGRVISGL